MSIDVVLAIVKACKLDEFAHCWITMKHLNSSKETMQHGQSVKRPDKALLGLLIRKRICNSKPAYFCRSHGHDSVCHCKGRAHKWQDRG